MSQTNPETNGLTAVGTNMSPQMSNMPMGNMQSEQLLVPPSPLLSVPTTKRARVVRGVLIGLVIAGILIAYWYNWAMGTYKWSLERLGSLMVDKYNVTPDLPELGKDYYYDYDNVKIATDKSYATCDIQKKNKISQKVVMTTSVKYAIVTAFDPPVDPHIKCGSFDFKCIVV
jgi:hypothetical protein